MWGLWWFFGGIAGFACTAFLFYFRVEKPLRRRIMDDAAAYSAEIDGVRREKFYLEGELLRHQRMLEDRAETIGQYLDKIQNLSEQIMFLNGEVKRLSDLTVSLSEEKRELGVDLYLADEEFYNQDQTVEAYEALILDLMEGVISREHEILANNNLVTSPKIESNETRSN